MFNLQRSDETRFAYTFGFVLIGFCYEFIYQKKGNLSEIEA